MEPLPGECFHFVTRQWRVQKHNSARTRWLRNDQTPDGRHSRARAVQCGAELYGLHAHGAGTSVGRPFFSPSSTTKSGQLTSRDRLTSEGIDQSRHLSVSNTNTIHVLSHVHQSCPQSPTVISTSSVISHVLTNSTTVHAICQQCANRWGGHVVFHNEIGAVWGKGLRLLFWNKASSDTWCFLL